MERIESQAEAHAHDSRLSRRSAAVQAAFFLPYLRPGMRVLDVGCGPGTITLGLAEAVAPGEVVGVDIVEDRLHLARAAAEERALANVRFEPGDIHHLPFRDGEFDAALVHGVLEHLPDPLAALGEVRRVLRPGAVVGIRSPEHSLAVMQLTIGASAFRGLPVQPVRRHESTAASDPRPTWADIVNP